MLPSIFGENLFDDMFNEAFDHFPMRSRRNHEVSIKNAMRTDVRETEKSYELDIDLAGFKKEEIKATIQDGYLTVNATKDSSKEEEKKDGQYIRKERFVSQCSRSFYVGQGVKQEDVNAKFEDGVLKIVIPKSDEKALPKANTINIE